MGLTYPVGPSFVKRDPLMCMPDVGYDAGLMADGKLSDTVLLPKTSFAMRGQLAKEEPKRIAKWKTENRYARLRQSRAGRPEFFLHDGPPYANGQIHIGHALNKVLKDIIVRYKTLRGFDAPYLPGWDCHGLPIELKTLESREISPGGPPGADSRDKKLKIRKACRADAEKYLAIQREEFLRLGILGEFDQPYVTMDPAYQADILEGLAQLVEMGFLTRSKKPVLWCARCRTALADAEVEYEDASSPSITVKFAVEGQPQTYLLVWTTTPWTLPANLAAAVNPELSYIKVRVKDELWILAESRAPALGIDPAAAVERFPGKDLVAMSYRHPLVARVGKVFPADFVTLDAGTGIVHIAPGHGEEDFLLGQKCQLDTFSPVDDAGRLTADAGVCVGQFVFDANAGITDLLRSSGALVRSEEMTHSYPHCWRCKQPVIFRATPQWFVRVDHRHLRQKMLDAIPAVRWVPPAGEKRIQGMIESRPDWCVSRQRAWGVPIPAVHCESCGEACLSPEVIRRVADRTRRETADVWFSEPPSAFLPPGWSCPGCGSARVRREEDILDVWFDSGMSHAAAFHRRHNCWPADLYLEGSDQHRGWFQVSLLLGVALKGAAPYRQVLTHGFVMDGAGRKMSKSLGNVVTPQEIVEQSGADVLRLWVAGCDYTTDVRLGPAILAETIDTYRKIRNTIRFLLANMSDLDPADVLPPEKLDPLDRHMLCRASDMARACLEKYEAYDFSSAIRRIRDFCNDDLSGFYLDVLKDRLYCDARDSLSRRSAQSALFLIAEKILHLVSPILPFTAEEAWEAWQKDGGVSPSDEYRDLSSVDEPADIRAAFDLVISLRAEINAALEIERHAERIGKSLDARVSIRTSGAEWQAMRLVSDRMAECCIVSSCLLEEAPPGERQIRVGRSPGSRCDRCWKYVPTLTPALNGRVCARCADVISGIPVRQ